MELYNSNGIISYDGTNYSWKGDFLGFTFGNIHSSSLGIVRTSDSNRYRDDLIPEKDNKTSTVPGLDETYYFGSNFTQRNFLINFAFDCLTEKQLRKLRRLCATKEPQELIFDETPYKVYFAVCREQPQLTYLCFTENKQRIYKGEGTLNLVSYSPFARARYKYSEDYNLYNIPEWGGVQNNKRDWLDSSGIRSRRTEFSIAAKLKPEKYNGGEVRASNALQKFQENNSEEEKWYRFTTNYIDNFQKADEEEVDSEKKELFSINYVEGAPLTDQSESIHITHEDNGDSTELVLKKVTDKTNWAKNQLIPLINPGDRGVPFKIQIFYDSLAVESNPEDKISKRYFHLYLNYGKKVVLTGNFTGNSSENNESKEYYVPDEERECGHLCFRLDWRCQVEVDMSKRLIKGDFIEMRKKSDEENDIENKVIKEKSGIILTGNIASGDFFNIPPTEDNEVLILRLDIENETKTNNKVSYQKGYFVDNSLEYNYLYY